MKSKTNQSLRGVLPGRRSNLIFLMRRFDGENGDCFVVPAGLLAMTAFD